MQTLPYAPAEALDCAVKTEVEERAEEDDFPPTQPDEDDEDDSLHGEAALEDADHLLEGEPGAAPEDAAEPSAAEEDGSSEVNVKAEEKKEGLDLQNDLKAAEAEANQNQANEQVGTDMRRLQLTMLASELQKVADEKEEKKRAKEGEAEKEKKPRGRPRRKHVPAEATAVASSTGTTAECPEGPASSTGASEPVAPKTRVTGKRSEKEDQDEEQEPKKPKTLPLVDP